MNGKSKERKTQVDVFTAEWLKIDSFETNLITGEEIQEPSTKGNKKGKKKGKSREEKSARQTLAAQHTYSSEDKEKKQWISSEYCSKYEYKGKGVKEDGGWNRSYEKEQKELPFSSTAAPAKGPSSALLSCCFFKIPQILLKRKSTTTPIPAEKVRQWKNSKATHSYEKKHATNYYMQRKKASDGF